MSIDDQIEELVKQKKLFRLPSMALVALGLPADETARTVYVTSDILAVVNPPFAEIEEGDRFAEFRLWLDGFSEGGEISVSEDPDNKPPETMMARVHPIERDFFSMRIHEPEDTAGIRCIGAFADKDEFIALVWGKREEINFDQEAQEAIQTWIDLFGNVAPHSGASIDEYISNSFTL